jgi:type IX secretion system PorP/SprF family membrane protein
MMKRVIFLMILLTAIAVKAQQFPQYTQFTFNKIGYNPAASGGSVKAPYELIMGARTQWLGMPHNPKSLFVSYNYNIVPTHSYRHWHNVGAYIDQDQNGNFVHNDVWLSYTYHMFITAKMVLAAGVFVGFKQYKITLNNLDRNDPAVINSSSSVFAVPDIVPGVRLTSRHFFADASLQQISVFSQRGFGGVIGTPSRVWPHYNMSAGVKAKLGYYNSSVLAVNLRGSFVSIPSIEVNLMDYISKIVGVGASLRGRNFVAGIVQIRVTPNLVVGLAADFSINKMAKAAPFTGEIMIALTPVFGGDVLTKKEVRVVDDCTF